MLGIHRDPHFPEPPHRLENGHGIELENMVAYGNRPLLEMLAVFAVILSVSDLYAVFEAVYEGDGKPLHEETEEAVPFIIERIVQIGITVIETEPSLGRVLHFNLHKPLERIVRVFFKAERHIGPRLTAKSSYTHTIFLFYLRYNRGYQRKKHPCRQYLPCLPQPGSLRAAHSSLPPRREKSLQQA